MPKTATAIKYKPAFPKKCANCKKLRTPIHVMYWINGTDIFLCPVCFRKYLKGGLAIQNSK